DAVQGAGLSRRRAAAGTGGDPGGEAGLAGAGLRVVTDNASRGGGPPLAAAPGARSGDRGPLIRPSGTFSRKGRRRWSRSAGAGLRSDRPTPPSPLAGEGGRRPDEGYLSSAGWRA